MDSTYTYKPEDGVFEVKGFGGKHVATFEQCYPFDLGSGRYAYRALEQDFSAALAGFFDSQYGGFDSTNRHLIDLRKAIYCQTALPGDRYVCMTAQVANLLSWGAHPQMKIVAEDAPGGQRRVWISPSPEETAILEYVFNRHNADISKIAAEAGMEQPAAMGALGSLMEKSYILRKGSGEYALTKAGFFLICEMARLSKEPLGDIRDNYGWDTFEESLVGIHGFEKDHFFLSNFFAAPVCYDAIPYLNSEAAYQSWRCADREERRVFSGLFAADAKKKGHHGVETRSDWDEIKLSVMPEVLHAKFDQNRQLAEQLASTYGELRETNDWDDNLWGDCICLSCSGTRGQNLLGEMLMEERGFWRKELRLHPVPHIPQEHEYHLFKDPFQKMLSGEKDVELRLWDGKRKKLHIGDRIKFLGPEAEQHIVAEVQTLTVFPSFEYLFREIEPGRCGSPDLDAEALAQSMRSYYSSEELEKHSVVAIGIRVIETT